MLQGAFSIDATEVSTRCQQKVCLAAAVVGLLLAFIDAALRAFLYQTYSAEPMSTFVLESAANTTIVFSVEVLITIISTFLQPF